MILAQLLFALSLYTLGALIMGLSLIPALLLVVSAWQATLEQAFVTRFSIIGFTVSAAYFIFGITMVLVVGLFRVMFGLKLQEGEYPMFSLNSVTWFVTNALQMLVSITFMDFMLLTPLANLHYRLMGAKLGRNVQINSKYCADLSLLEIGDGAVIGGHATVIGHSFERGKLILKKVKIGKQAIIGLNAVVLPGAEIGERAMIAAGAVVPKNTIVPAGTVYLGPDPAAPKNRA